LIASGGNLIIRLLPTRIARILIGKHKPIYDPSTDCGDNVLVVNARFVHFTGEKWKKKLYRWHTGYPGGLKERKKHIYNLNVNLLAFSIKLYLACFQKIPFDLILTIN